MNENALPLRDLHLPDAIGWWPLAPGWWVILAIVAAVLGYVAWRLHKRWLFNAPRRHALRELARFEAEYLELRKHKGMTPEKAQAKVSLPHYFGALVVRAGEVDQPADPKKPQGEKPNRPGHGAPIVEAVRPHEPENPQ